jgi:hypothetical protein
VGTMCKKFVSKVVDENGDELDIYSCAGGKWGVGALRETEAWVISEL